jgi:hypothetical protein
VDLIGGRMWASGDNFKIVVKLAVYIFNHTPKDTASKNKLQL